MLPNAYLPYSLACPAPVVMSGRPADAADGVFGDRDAGHPARGRRTIAGGGLFGRLANDPPLPPPAMPDRKAPQGRA